jgi:hypothetical protein
MELSQLKVYSLGRVAANKALDSHVIEVVPIEDSPMTDGAISDNVTSVQAKAQDASGSAYETQVSTTASVKATWFALGQGNRLTAPDVRRGEKVILYRFADSDEFHWVTQEYDMKLRKLETVIYGFSATRDETVPSSAANMYFIEISTHKKLIHLHTSKADGEPFAYDIQLDTSEGRLVIADDAGNSFVFDSPERQLTMRNADGSFIDLNKLVLSIETGDQISMKTVNYVLNCDTMVQKASSSIDTTTATQTVKAETTHTGNHATVGNAPVSGDVSIGGSISQGGGGSGGTATFNNDIIIEGISFLGHRHTEQGDGAEVSPPH